MSGVGTKMKIYSKQPSSVRNNTRSNESGSALVVGLVILLVLTILGVIAMQTTALEERMAGNLRDRDLAFQATEAALREGEAFLQAATLPPFDGTNGLYQPDPTLWKDTDVWSSSILSWEYGGEIEGVSDQPRYIIEELPPMPEPAGSLAADEPIPDAGLYRLTARGVGGTDTAVVILQTTFKR
ncbi:type IV pilus assembly protein PilX [Desulfonatronum zhilinae]|nr:type IV pilus assembly protein PilX [Desulfonatronum zhilinae]